MPSDAGLKYVTGHPDIGNRWPELALALGVPSAHINPFSVFRGATELRYWRNGKVDSAETTWEFLLQKVQDIFGAEVEASMKRKIASDPLLTRN